MKGLIFTIGFALVGLALIGAVTPDASRGYFLLSMLLGGFSCIGVGLYNMKKY